MLTRRANVLWSLLIALPLLFAVFPQVALAVQMDVVAWAQADSRWGTLRLGGSSSTMASSGCAVTSCAMVAVYFGSTKDPGQLCRALNSNGGLDSRGRIYWEKVPPAAGGTITYVGRFDYPGGADLARINRELDAGYPVVSEVRRKGNMHFVVLTGRDGGTYRINDPAHGDRTTLNARYGSPATAVRSIRVYRGQPQGSGAPEDPQEPEEPPGERWFRDVPPSSAYFTAIEALAEARIVSGYLDPDGNARFRPGNPLLRAQFAKLVCGAFGLHAQEGLTASFVDMGADNPHDLYPHNYVGAAANEGIVLGKSPTVFDPWSDVARAQVVTMVVRAARSLFPEFLEAPPDTFAGTFGSFDSAHGENMRVAEYNGLLRGIDGFGRGWDPWKHASRGEVVQVLYNWMRVAGMIGAPGE